MKDTPSRFILMVEDSLDDIEAVRRWLAKSESTYELRVEETLGAAVDAVGERIPDLILLDLNLPDSHGLESLDRIRAVANDVPIVVFSGHADRSMAILAVRSGAEDYVLKDEVASPEHLTRPMDLAIERSRRRLAEKSLLGFQNQLALAHRIQQMLLPDPTDRFEGVQWCGRCEPAEQAGGDFYDIMDLPDGRLAFVIADVSGHGLVPAMVMMETRAILRAMAMMCDDPGTILTHANKILCRDVQLRYFVTMFLGFLCPERKIIRYASAGHPAYRISPVEPACVLSSKEPPLGIVDTMTYVTHQVPSHFPVSTLLMFTDGILDSVSPDAEYQSFDHVVEKAVRVNHGSLRDVIDSLFENMHSIGAERDDCTALLLRASTSESDAAE
ncbi:PP2C family protein-serine/threonine phosphatase [Novipirellula sp. SH528]|uniref:PP2C family protein-serine/threonine phosphatase n=1 Tax=Novipirellula sp. SH528 TaxID=3454466 RepID=UPI003FA195C4